MQSSECGFTILIAENDLETRAHLEMALKCFGYRVMLATNGEEAITYLRSSLSEISAVLLGLILPNVDAMDVLREIRMIKPDLPVIIVSEAATTLDVVTAMKCGADDFLRKPVAHEELRAVLSKALENTIRFPPQTAATTPISRGKVFYGTSPQMRDLQSHIQHVGLSEAPVLIQGETGSGKEILARALHAVSPRANKIFLKINCAALPSELVESELFGYERGAFTGAFQKKIGMFEAADGGTILLDEIGDMDVRLQAKLLQVLQDREFQRIGGREMIKVDVRVIAATHRDLDRAIVEGSFREDLFYRLNVINLVLPSLRERREDIIPLAEHLLRKHGIADQPVTITEELKHALLAYPWPGNVRELENVMRKLIVLRDPNLVARELHSRAVRNTTLRATGLNAPEHVPASEPHGNAILEQVTKAKQQAEMEAILVALHSTHWNRKQAAALLKIDYKALLYKMKKLGVTPSQLSVHWAAWRGSLEEDANKAFKTN